MTLIAMEIFRKMMTGSLSAVCVIRNISTKVLNNADENFNTASRR